MIFKKIKENRGFVLLFAVTLAAIFLSIALGVGQIALKENNFSTSAIDTNDAFFAADTGVECALFYDNPNGDNPYGSVVAFVDGNNPQITCNNSTVTANEAGSGSLVWNFIISGLGSTGNGCVAVKVDKKTNSPHTTVSASGYNIGGSSCLGPAGSVARELTTTY
ncbi:MAG: hypothetical protein P4L63_01900 [Candidatus Pacebacteria bacterium]|nr:hypothetical protein [Candidatus Paceibacterota bacterium]